MKVFHLQIVWWACAFVLACCCIAVVVGLLAIAGVIPDPLKAF